MEEIDKKIMMETPYVEVNFSQNDKTPTGLGESVLPPAGGVIANAIKAATDYRLMKQPFIKELDKVRS